LPQRPYRKFTFGVGMLVGSFVGEKVGLGVVDVPPLEDTANTTSSMSSYPLEGHWNGFEVLAFPCHRNTTLTA
jgi:hypothetical protein